MTFAIVYLVVFAMLSVTALLTVREFFLTSRAGGYAFVAINWVLLALVSAVIVLLIEYLIAMVSV